MFYNIKTKDVRANGRGRGRVGTPYYIIRARVKDGRDGDDGVNGEDGKGTPRWETRSGTFTGRGILPDGGNTFTREGKGGYMAGEREKRGRRNYQEGREEKAIRGKKLNSKEREEGNEKGRKMETRGREKETRRRKEETKGRESRKLEEGRRKEERGEVGFYNPTERRSSRCTSFICWNFRDPAGVEKRRNLVGCHSVGTGFPKRSSPSYSW